MKKFLIILFNILLLTAAYFLIDFIIYKAELMKIESNNTIKYFNSKPNFTYTLFNPTIHYDYLKSHDYDILRKPSGSQYNTMPITIFGCSVGYGQYLSDTQNFGYYLSLETQRPVFNRSISGSGLQNMLYQAESDEFYSDVPYSPDVIYVYINDHKRRMLGLPFNILDRSFFLKYKNINGKLIKEDYNNPIKNFIRSSYLINLLKALYYDKYLIHQNKKLADEAILYFLNTRELLENHWGKKFTFYVFFFINTKGDRYLIDNLKNNGFKVILINDLTNIKLNQPPYLAEDNLHPSDEVWKLITPKIADIISK